MDSQMMTGNLAAAWGARLADVDYIPAFPITPQTEIVEALAKWCERTLQPFQIGAVAGDGEKGLTQVLAHWDNPLRLSKLPFSRKNMR